MKLLSILMLLFAFSFTGCASKKCCMSKCDDKKECCKMDKKCEGETCDKTAKKCCINECKGKCDPAKDCKNCASGECAGENCPIKKTEAAAAPVATPAPVKKKK